MRTVNLLHSHRRRLVSRSASECYGFISFSKEAEALAACFHANQKDRWRKLVSLAKAELPRAIDSSSLVFVGSMLAEKSCVFTDFQATVPIGRDLALVLLLFSMGS